MSQIKAPKGATHKGVNSVGAVKYWLSIRDGSVWSLRGELITSGGKYRGREGIKRLAEDGYCEVKPCLFQLENK